MGQTRLHKMLAGLLSTLLGVCSGLAGSIITILSASVQSRWVAQDAESILYGFPLPWMSKSLGFTFSFEDFLNQARAPPTVNYSAFVVDFLLYSSPFLVLVYLLIGVWSRYRNRRVSGRLSASGALLSFAGVQSVLLAMILALSSLSNRVTLVRVDGEVNRYGSPLPWLSKALGDAAIDTMGLLQQIRAPPVVDYQALLADLAFYALPALVLTYGLLGLIYGSQYLAKRISTADHMSRTLG